MPRTREPMRAYARLGKSLTWLPAASALPSEMFICAAREDLIVTVEMVNDDGVLEKPLAGAGTADETDHGNQQRYSGPLHRAAIRPCFFASYLLIPKWAWNQSPP
jgi:hypothetical protein